VPPISGRELENSKNKGGGDPAEEISWTSLTTRPGACCVMHGRAVLIAIKEKRE